MVAAGAPPRWTHVTEGRSCSSPAPATSTTASTGVVRGVSRIAAIAGRDASVTLSVLPVIAVGLAIALAAGRSLNAPALGDDVARCLGAHVGRARVLATLGFALLAGGAVAAAGPVAFVGLAVPHIARALIGHDYRWIVPYSALLGAALLLAGDVLGRVVARPQDLSAGIVTALPGAPFFVWLVRRRRLVAL